MLSQTPKGTKDIYGSEVYAWQWLENIMRKVSHRFGACEIRTPTFEHTELFTKNIGETTDIVNKEMYTFEDNGGRSISLKPEGTAGVARSFIEHKMYANPQPTKLFYITSAFRSEKPQAGRYREFHQYGVEFIGSYSPACDAEVISIGYEILRAIGVDDVRIKVNSLGEKESRAAYHSALKQFIADNYDSLCPACKERYEKNPLRVLDCKVEGCKAIVDGAPSVLDYLVEEDKAHFEKVQEILEEMEIPYEIDPKIVRGLDYYTRTVFEIIGKDIGAQSTLCGGGRYDNLIEETGGPKTGACGFAMGMERLLMVLEEKLNEDDLIPQRDIFVGAIGEKGYLKSQALVFSLRQAGICAEGDTLGRSVKAQMKYADKLGVRYSIILGDTEIEEGKGKLKNMLTGEEISLKLSQIKGYILEEQGEKRR